MLTPFKFVGDDTLNQELRTLCQLQEIDTKIFAYEKKKSGGPQRIQELDREVKESRERLDKQKTVIEELEKEIRKKEKDLESEKEKIKKSEGRLLEIKTNKEYQALLKEIEAARTDNEKIEEEVIALMEQIEGMKKDYDSFKKHFAKREKEIDAERAELEKEVESIDSVILRLRKERTTVMKDLPADLRSRYEMLIERRQGVGVVSVRNGVCLGCFMNIPPQLFIEVTKNCQIIACPSCNRILYYQEEEEE